MAWPFEDRTSGPYQKGPGASGLTSSGTVFDNQKLNNQIERLKDEARRQRRIIATEAMKSMLSNPNCPCKTEKEIAEFAVACADSLLNTLEVTEQVKEKLNS